MSSARGAAPVPPRAAVPAVAGHPVPRGEAASRSTDDAQSRKRSRPPSPPPPPDEHDHDDDEAPAVEAGEDGDDVDDAEGLSPAAAAAAAAERKERRRLQKAAKKAKRHAALNAAGGVAAVVTPATASVHPFATEPSDHAETPFEAYAHVEPLLFKLCERLGRTKESVVLYDPFFCEGSVVAHLARLGFKTVVNRNEDFYSVWAEGRVPAHDILITNPPFSGDHIERTLRFAAENGKPWLLLLPQFIAKKAYYVEWLKTVGEAPPTPTAASAAAAASGGGKGAGKGGAGGSSSSSSSPSFINVRPVYVGPRKKPYAFTAPSRGADGSSKLVEGRSFTSPSLGFQVFSGHFQCVWFCCLGAHLQAGVAAWWRKKYETAESPCALADDVMLLPQLMAVPKPDPAKRRWRKKLNRLHKAQQGGGGGGGGGGGREQQAGDWDGGDDDDGGGDGGGGGGGRRPSGAYRPGERGRPGSWAQGRG
jgi:hypothetical protein